MSKNVPRIFESLEPRHALDGAVITHATQLPLQLSLGATPCLAPACISGSSATTIQALPLMGMRIYTAPIGPRPLPVMPASAAAAQPGNTLPLSLSAISGGDFHRLGTALAYPIGPARPANLPAQPQPLYAAGSLPEHTPVKLPAEHQKLTIITEMPTILPLTEIQLH